MLCFFTFFLIIFVYYKKNYRSLALEEDKNLEDTKDKDGEGKANSSGIQTLDSLQAMCLPLGASVSLLVMFFFFDSMQMLFAICTAVIATVALAFLLLPMCQYLMRYVILLVMDRVPETRVLEVQWTQFDQWGSSTKLLPPELKI